MKKRLNFLYSWFVWIVTFFLPDAPAIMRFRGWLYSFGMPKCGNNFQVASSVRILGLLNLSVGDHVFLATGVVINAREEIILHDEVLIGINSLLVSSNHTRQKDSYRFGEPTASPIIIGRGSWVAGNVVVGAGANVPNSSLIGANSYVNKKLTVIGLYAGNPVKLIKEDLEVN
ncbi:acyltransferase [Vibrio splendidus]